MLHYWLSLCLLFVVPTYGQDFLSVDQAFQIVPQRLSETQLSVDFQVQPGHYLYRDRIQISQPFAKPHHFPKPNKFLTDPSNEGQQLAAYAHSFTLHFPLAHPLQNTATLTYQGCAGSGICYPPQTKTLQLNWQQHKASLIQNTPLETEHEHLISIFEHNLAYVALSFLFLGLLLSFTPCVLPIVPILPGLITAHRDLTTGKALCLSTIYVLSMAVSYALIGLAASFLGSHLQAQLQTPWVLSLSSLILVLLALSLFDVYELRLPHFLQQRLNRLNQRQQGGSYLGVALMGCLATLIISPCVSAPLVAVLGYIAQTGDALLGALSLFCLGLGMGIPLLLIGACAGKWLPHTGPWMQTVKACFGVGLLAMALWLLSRIIPAPLTLFLIGSLMIACAVYLGALRQVARGWPECWKSLGLIVLCYGVLLIVGAGLGHSNPLKPLALISPPHTNATPARSSLIKVNDVPHLQQQLAQAKGQWIMVDVYADWCLSCKILEHNTLNTPTVKQALRGFTIIQADVTSTKAPSLQLLSHLQIIAPPALIFYNPKGHEVLRLMGEIGTDRLLNHLAKLH